MAIFDLAMEKTLKWEGAGGQVTTDSGGLTKYGISQKAYPNLNIAALTKADAVGIYRRDYWTPLKLDLFKNQNLANAVFDFGVNAGRKTAAKQLQILLNLRGEKLTIDGIIGEKTIAAANAATADFVNAFTKGRQEFYKNLARMNTERYGQYLKGWLNRSNDFFYNATAVKVASVSAAALGAWLFYKAKIQKG